MVHPATQQIREVPYAPAHAQRIAEAEGSTATQRVPSTLWSGLDLDALRPHLERIAAAELTDMQLAVFTRWLAQEKTDDIAAALGITRQVVSKHLHGDKREGELHRGGAFNKLRRALLRDEHFLAEYAAVKTERAMPDDDERLRVWFTALRPQTMHLFVPLAALLVFDSFADAQRKITFGDAYTLLPKPVVSEAVRWLKPLGMIETDGITIKILRTPPEDNR